MAAALTEGFVTILDKYDYPAKPNSVGVPPQFFDMKIVNEKGEECAPGEVGEICGKGPILMPGYYKRPDLTRDAIIDGWLHSGDLGYVDEDGFLYLVDRKKDMIISGGVNVYPRDIEEIVAQHPEVRDAAVFGIPDEKWGESPLAAVVLNKPGAVTAEELKAWINERVGAKYNYFPGWHQPATNLELVINKDTWNKMSPRQKAVMELAVRAVTTYTVARSTAIQGAAIVENAKKGVNNMVFSQELLDLFHKTWLEVIEEETAKDPMLKKIWEDYKAYEAAYIPWACMAYLPRPKCK